MYSCSIAKNRTHRSKQHRALAACILMLSSRQGRALRVRNTSTWLARNWSQVADLLARMGEQRVRSLPRVVQIILTPRMCGDLCFTCTGGSVRNSHGMLSGSFYTLTTLHIDPEISCCNSSRAIECAHLEPQPPRMSS